MPSLSLSSSIPNEKSQPRRSPRLAQRTIVFKSCVCCDICNASSFQLNEIAEVNDISKNSCSSRKKSRRSSIPSLPIGIIYNILVFLPADILYNVMRYICRDWYNIINNPEFIHSHLHKSIHALFIQRFDHPEMVNLVEIHNSDVRIRRLSHWFPNHICSSCDGLVLFSHHGNDHMLCVSNLVTKQTLTLPSLGQPMVDFSVCALVYAHSIRRYKVVCVCNSVKGLELKCAILTLGSENAWRFIDTKHIVAHIEPYFSETYSTLFAGGYLYWTPRSRVSCNYLLALDVEDETIHKLPNPKSFIGKGGYFTVTESSLAFMVQNRDFFWEVWVLTELDKGSEWTRLYNMDLYGESGMLNEMVDPKNRSISRCLIPLVWLKNGELVIFRVSDQWTTYIVYDIKTKGVSSFTLEGSGGDGNNIYHAHVNSLVSLKISGVDHICKKLNALSCSSKRYRRSNIA